MTQPNAGIIPGSFRDPSGFLFRQDGVLYRQVNHSYQAHYDHLMESGLYERLTTNGRLVPHVEASLDLARSAEAYRILQPELIPFVSYPYEWSFSQLKDAALATLAIQKTALRHNMILKDASAYNIQFVGYRPTLVDTLSFETYREGKAWPAYRQFCQHFLAPLALMAYRDVRLGLLLGTHLDGIPLDLAARLLPFRTRFVPGVLIHLHLHAAGQRRYAGRAATSATVSRQSLLGIVDNLESTIRGLKWNPHATAWAGYYQDDSYDAEGLADKQRLVAEYLDHIKPAIVWDMGANTGLYSRIARERASLTLSLDGDPGGVELNYHTVVAEKDTRMLPLLIDLTNPSSSLGWAGEERDSLHGRGPADALMALALVHHLAIGNNVPLDRVAAYFAGLCLWLIVEFVPKSDPKVQVLLRSREDIFPTYTQAGFEVAFASRFEIVRQETITHSERILYLMRRSGEA